MMKKGKYLKPHVDVIVPLTGDLCQVGVASDGTDQGGLAKKHQTESFEEEEDDKQSTTLVGRKLWSD